MGEYKVMDVLTTLATMVKYGALLFLAIGQVLKICGTLKF